MLAGRMERERAREREREGERTMRAKGDAECHGEVLCACNDINLGMDAFARQLRDSVRRSCKLIHFPNNWLLCFLEPWQPVANL